MIQSVFLFLLISMNPAKSVDAKQTITFPSKDGLMMTADWYPVSSTAPIILLCHQNRFSRGEYLETAPKLNDMGYNCLAIDQRVGDSVNGIRNETAFEAIKKGMKPEYADAEQDILAAIEYLNSKYSLNIMLLGSSYSASLALKIAAENTSVSAVITFSPGEYFPESDFIARNIQTLIKPVFATSSKAESDAVTDLLKDVNSRIKIQYIPETEGTHGSKVLWANDPASEKAWMALTNFLNYLHKHN